MVYRTIGEYDLWTVVLQILFAIFTRTARTNYAANTSFVSGFNFCNILANFSYNTNDLMPVQEQVSTLINSNEPLRFRGYCMIDGLMYSKYSIALIGLSFQHITPNIFR